MYPLHTEVRAASTQERKKAFQPSFFVAVRSWKLNKKLEGWERTVRRWERRVKSAHARACIFFASSHSIGGCKGMEKDYAHLWEREMSGDVVQDSPLSYFLGMRRGKKIRVNPTIEEWAALWVLSLSRQSNPHINAIQQLHFSCKSLYLVQFGSFFTDLIF